MLSTAAPDAKDDRPVCRERMTSPARVVHGLSGRVPRRKDAGTTRTTRLPERPVETSCKLPRRFDAERPSAHDAGPVSRAYRRRRPCKARTGMTAFSVRPVTNARFALPQRPPRTRQNRYTSMSTPTGQWSDPCSSGQMKASRTRFIAAGEARM